VKPSFYRLGGLAAAIAIISTWLSLSQQGHFSSWKFNVGLPGSLLGLYVGWFLGPLSGERLVYFGVPFLINAVTYYVILRVAIAFRNRHGGQSSSGATREVDLARRGK
jgi:hypothetical protein